MVGLVAALAANHLADHVKPNGMFVYRGNLNPEVSLEPRYNIVRHAGAIYAMAMHDAARPDEKVRSAMLRAGRYLRDEAIHPLPGDETMSAVWSRPEVNHTSAPMHAKLGGSGLGLAALLSIERVRPGFTPMAQLGGLGRFILYMQKPEGDFHSKYIPAKGGRDDSRRCLYYPGEAALGLVMLYEKDPNPAWLAGATRALTYLADSRRGAGDAPLDHWALIATERLFALSSPPAVTSETRKKLTTHAARICAGMVKRWGKKMTPGQQVRSSVNTTQVSCTLEGLQAALAVLPPGHPLRPRMEAVIKEGILFLLGAQAPAGPHKGAIPYMAAGSGGLAAGGGSRTTEIRIDYTQHALSALVRYAQRASAGR